MAEIAICPDGGVISQTGGANVNGPVIRCDAGWQIVEYVPPFEVSTLDPVTVALFVGSGFFILVPIWLAVYSVRGLLALLKRS